MPSSLTTLLPSACGFSPHLPVSVYGTGTYDAIAAFLGSVDSETSLLLFSPRNTSPKRDGFAYLLPYLLKRLTNWALYLSFCVITSLKRLHGGTGISTSFPSTTPFGLALGPDLPWADEPSPGILRFSAGRILTCLFAYLYLHSHFSTLQHSFRYTFSVLRTLLYQYILRHIPQLR